MEFEGIVTIVAIWGGAILDNELCVNGVTTGMKANGSVIERGGSRSLWED